MILVAGAGGNVGRHVYEGLASAGHEVRGLSRTTGDLTRPETLAGPLTGVETVFLLWPALSPDGIQTAVDTITATAKRVVYLSAAAADSGFWGVVEQALRRSGADWTFLRAGGFAANTLGWAPMIRETGEVRWPYGEAGRSLIHERDLADVAIRALTEDGHTGRTYELTGPETITQAEQARQIGEAIGRDVRWVETPRAEAREQLLREWGDPAFVDGALTHWASLVDHPEPVTGTVAEITGRPARTFREWARDHAADFGRA